MNIYYIILHIHLYRYICIWNYYLLLSYIIAIPQTQVQEIFNRILMLHRIIISGKGFTKHPKVLYYFFRNLFGRSRIFFLLLYLIHFRLDFPLLWYINFISVTNSIFLLYTIIVIELEGVTKDISTIKYLE